MTEELSGRPIVVSIGNFNYTGGFRFERTTKREYRGEYPPEFTLSPGEVLVVMTCQTAGGEILGVPARVPNDGRTYLHNQRLGRVKILDGDRVDLGFLYWVFVSQDFNEQLVRTASGTKILHTAPTRIEEATFLLPPLPQQRGIAKILGDIDDKIELNRRMNETLEGMARALFKSWFVDFDPVRAKLEGRQPEGMDAETAGLFPDRLVESELGEIPEGWKIAPIADIAKQVAMGPFGSDIRVSTFVPVGVPVISGQHLHGTQLEDTDYNFVSSEHAARLGRSNVWRGDVVFTHAGSIGQVAFIPETSTYEHYVISQRQFYVRCDPSLMSHFYLTYYFKTDIGQHRLLANTSSSGVPSIAQPVTYMRSLRIVVPPSCILREFDLLLRDFHLKIGQLSKETGSLTAMRDALLPQLLSGKLRVGQQ